MAARSEQYKRKYLELSHRVLQVSVSGVMCLIRGASCVYRVVKRHCSYNYTKSLDIDR